MLNKYVAQALIPGISMLVFFSTANAYEQDNDGNIHSINLQAWSAFKSAKQNEYELTHTLKRAPFPHKISSGNIIEVNLQKLAWAAYDAQGNIVRWGSASGGRDFCPDINKSCRSLTGTYTFYSKKGADCKSNLFPIGRGGAPMPYCMHFNGGYALHGSGAVPDFNASHGCVRIPVAEAKWLNQNFVTVGKTRINITYD